MTTLESKSDIIALINNPVFQDLLDISSADDFVSRRYEWPNSQYEYFADPDSDVSSGVQLFSTPSRGNNCGEGYGTWLNVVKLYGNPELAYRVLGTDHTPDGNDHNETMIVGDVRTLTEALDLAFKADELKSFYGYELEDALAGAQSPADQGISNQIAQSVAQLEKAKAAEVLKEHARGRRYWAGIDPADFQTIMGNAKSNGLKLSDHPNVEYAFALNSYLLNGKGEIFGCYNDSAREALGVHVGLAVVGIADTKGAYTYFDQDGVPKTEDQIKNTAIEFMKNEFFPKEVGTTFKFSDHDWEYDVNLADNSFEKMEDQILNDYLIMEDHQDLQPAHSLIGGAAHAFREEREKQYQARLSKENELSQGM